MGDLKKAYSRLGWAEESMRIAAGGDEGLVWPEFGNDDDHLLTWPDLDLDIEDAPSSRASEVQTRDPS